jgi:hypothetical protein
VFHMSARQLGLVISLEASRSGGLVGSLRRLFDSATKCNSIPRL